MKISLRWIFDHIESSLSTVDVATLVNTFIKTTAEIEEWRHASLDLDTFTLIQVTEVGNTITTHSSEYNKHYTLPARADVRAGVWYLIKITNNVAQWATIESVGGTKETLLPAFFVEESLQSGAWKKSVEIDDYIVDIDNKSINHRPDLWGHRGLAREIAAMLNVSLKSLDAFIAKDIIKETNESMLQSSTGEFVITLKAHDACQRFAALHIDAVENRPSIIDMVIRLSRLDAKAIDFLVDCTNYVMLDLGHPMHAFDATSIDKKDVIIRHAHDKEKLTLLDGETVTLRTNDLVIADAQNAISLAGVMGGASTGVHNNTRSLLLEAALFDAATIRRTAAHYKKRTEASMRFEKSLDPNHIENALARFLFLLNHHNVFYTVKNKIAIVGHKNAQVTVLVSHVHIERLLGITISSERVSTILEKIGFTVTQTTDNNDTFYNVIVPSFRTTKDIAIEEDIIEEIGRFVGYDTLTPIMPLSRLKPSDLSKTYATRAMKHLLSSGLLMRELYGYSFFDESFLRELTWEAHESVELKNPISENYTRLVTTLQPNILKAIKDNSIHHTQLRFYEWGRVWHNNNDIVEKKSVAGIFFEQATTLDFYEGKSLLSRLFKELRCDVTWEKNRHYRYPWLSEHQSASIIHNNECIGVAGMIEDSTMNKLSPAAARAFIFEVNAEYLIAYKHPMTHFVHLSKYPAVRRDVSILVPLSVTVADLIASVKNIDKRIRTVTLIDFFSRPEWKDQKSLTLHIELRDDNKTLEHDEVEMFWNKIIARLHEQGATIR